jgi:hypothetical protein
LGVPRPHITLAINGERLRISFAPPLFQLNVENVIAQAPHVEFNLREQGAIMMVFLKETLREDTHAIIFEDLLQVLHHHQLGTLKIYFEKVELGDVMNMEHLNGVFNMELFGADNLSIPKIMESRREFYILLEQ